MLSTSTQLYVDGKLIGGGRAKWEKLVKLLNHSSIDSKGAMKIQLPLVGGGYETWDNTVEEFEHLMGIEAAFRRHSGAKVGDNILDFLVEEDNA